MKETHAEWFRRVTRGDSNRRASTLADISDATLSRQLRAGELSADIVIKIAEAYEESPVVALVDLGFISARWLNDYGVTTALTRVTDEELTDELLRRLRLLDSAPVDQLAERRRRMSTPGGSLDDGTVPNFDEVYSPGEYAADSSPDETEERLKRGEDFID